MALASAVLKRMGPRVPLPYQAATPLVFPNLGKAVQSSSDFNMLQNLGVSVKGVERLFDPNDPYTVFAPRNGAFASIPRSLLNEIWIPGNQLWPRVFWHHVAVGNYRKENLKGSQTLKVLDGETVRVDFKDGRVSVDDLPVVGMLYTRTSVIYVIDSLLIPSSARQEFRMRKY